MARLVREGDPPSVLRLSGLPLVLLAYLAMQERPQQRSHIARLFWPKTERANALRSLRQLLLRIRSVLPGAIEATHDVVGIEKDALPMDLLDFRERIRAGDLDRALELWRGPFLEGFERGESWELEEWVEQQRTRLESTLLSAVEVAAEGCLEAGQPDRAVALLERARHRLRGREELRALEVRALAAAGRVPEASGHLSVMDPEDRASAIRPLAEAVQDAKRLAVLDHGNNHEVAPSAGRPPSRHRAWAWPAAFSVLFVGTAASLVLSGPDGPPPLTIGDSASVLFCTSRATEGTQNQLFRMSLDGNTKHRVALGDACVGWWVESAGVLIASVMSEGGVRRLARYLPSPSNGIAEWTLQWIDEAANLRDPDFTRGSNSVVQGRWVVFEATDSLGNVDLYVLDAAEGGLRRLTDDPASEYAPTVDPAGGWVVFTSEVSGRGDLFRVPFEGGRVERLTDHPLPERTPDIHGDSVLFARGLGMDDEDGNLELILLDLTTGEETQLTDNDWNDYVARWSPNGRSICWQSERLGHYESEIMVMDLGSGEVTNVSSSPGRDADCHWSPDGSLMLYLSWRTGDAEIYLTAFPPDGSEALNLSRYPGEEHIVGTMPARQD